MNKEKNSLFLTAEVFLSEFLKFIYLFLRLKAYKSLENTNL